jgi:serine protease AprX
MRPHRLRRAAEEARRALSALLALLIVLVSGAAVPAQAEGRPRALDQLVRESSAAPEQTFRVIVGRAGRGREADDYVRGRGHRRLRDLGRAGFVAEVKGKDVAALSRHRAVRWLTIDAPVATTKAAVDSSKLATVYEQTLNATAVWDDGITGQGVGIAIIDTGVDDARADFKDPDTGASRVVAKVNTNAAAATVADGYGHGTHVAAIAAGNSWAQAPGPNQGKYVGVAPGANLIAVRVSDDQGRTYLSDVMSGIDWVIANRQLYNIRVLNLSLSSTVAESARTSYLAAAVERAWLNGILVVVAAGNQGPNTALYPPGNDPFVVSVGADDPVGTTARADDRMAPWSSYGTTQDGFVKPDVVAPGRRIASSLASGTPVMGTSFPTRKVDGEYIWMSGTSMAAPQVAGVAALAYERTPSLTNDGLKWLLTFTATPVGGAVPLVGQGAGLVDARAAVLYAGTPGVANNGLRINVHLVGPNGATIYTPVGPTGATWTEGGWDSTTWTEGGWDSSTWSSVSAQSMTYSSAPVE